jgi:hypothetical protein
MKYVVKELGRTTARQIGAKGSAARASRVIDQDGHASVRYTIDFGSKTIDDDLTYVFGRNVAQARKENKRLTGSADGIVRKR